MKKRILSLVVLLCVVIAWMPTTVFAADVTPIYVCGTEITGGGYWLNDGNGGITTTNASSSNYNVKYDTSTKKLTLNGANLTYNNNTIYTQQVSDSSGLDIVLEGTNSVTSTSSGDAALNTLGSGNIKIQGSGSLTATGVYSGIYAFNDIIIDSGTIVATGTTYAIESNRGDIIINGGTVTFKSSTQAMHQAPKLGAYTNVNITASTDVSGAPPVTCNPANINTYKYLKFEQGSTPPTITVKIQYVNKKGFSIKPEENIEVKVGDTLTAPNIDGYTPYKFISYGLTSVGGDTSIYSDEIGTIENPVNTVEIKTIEPLHLSPAIYIYYTLSSYTISGTIKGSDTQKGIAATVQLRNATGDVIATSTASATGEYTFSNIIAGTYTIAVSHKGYNDGTINNVIVSNANITNKDITLTKTAVVVPPTPITPPAAEQPKIIEGANQSVEQGKDATFRSNADMKDFVKVLIDGKEVPPEHYILKEGSTIVTLKADYVKKLSAGNYTLSIVSTTGSADTQFSVVKTGTPSDQTNSLVKNPQTSDNTNALLFSILLIAFAGGALTLILKLRKDCK
ncbi:carboxypeptidase regulatory-like domain-containing protein [Paludicola sp. MB14-C6]|uniref:carboxypeptidase regulatory-like domain-containing protein n=1 Tax=Paludihabitans sp. MB14-C6 TaxID=3070656 RepID=UPI0027DD91B4|nr:carboxypeptidase regulatory-like domain-containing protein [Paludicola sp. MB14-C6]WMJ21916.1 carboxypeptidase regulatory-like domain-containing protein [Paludicola sp. MB14-C6]